MDNILNDFGWVAPDGTFYECGYWEHQYFAKKILGKSEVELENCGWLKITLQSKKERVIFSVSSKITQAQFYTLLNHGFSENEIEDKIMFVI